MRLLKLSVAALTLSLSKVALATGGGDRACDKLISDNQRAMEAYTVKKGKDEPPVQDYRYGMKPDIARVVNVIPPIRSCDIVPSRMTYEDSSGKLSIIKYQVMGLCRNNGR